MSNKDYITAEDGKNLKFKREALLNYGMNRWGLNKAASVDAVSELIRACAPRTFDDWSAFYFEKAVQRKKDGLRITRDYLEDLGRRLHVKLSEVVQGELASITEEECVDYVFNLVLNRTYEGYRTEIDTVYGQLEAQLAVKIEPAPDQWDRSFNVDFFIKCGKHYIGLQIKPISTKTSPSQYAWQGQLAAAHARFTERFGGKVPIVYSIASGKTKEIQNPEIMVEIRKELDRLKEV